MPDMKKIAVASLLFSLAITLIRLFILSFYGTDTGSYQITGVLIGVANEFAIGFLITYAFAATLNKRLSSVLVFLIFPTVATWYLNTRGNIWRKPGLNSLLNMSLMKT